MDLEEEGWDRFTGHGLFILPNPEDIDVSVHEDTEETAGGDIMKFEDVENDRWSVSSINLLSDLGLIQGYPDGTFKPEQPVTREELATLFANLFTNYDIKKKA